MKFGWFPFHARQGALVLALVFIVTGCGKQDAPGSDKRATVDLSEAQRSAQLTQVSCFSEADCNPSVAMLAAAWAEPAPGVSVCTGFLVAPDVLATNSHCLPGDLDRPGATCSGRLWIFFPAMSGLPEERLECETVISSTGNSESVPGQDIAFLRLKTRSSRPSLQLSRDGFADKSKVKLVKVNPEPGQGGGYDVGTMQTVECETEQHSSRLPSFDDTHSPVVALGTCEVLHGNSGGPVLDSHGRAVGIIQAFFNPSNIDPDSLLGGPGSMIGRLNVATSMACVQSPVDQGTTYSSACNNMPGQDDERHTSRWIEAVSQRMQGEADAIYAQWEAAHPTGIRWKSRSLEASSTLIPAGSSTQYDIYLVPIPDCVGRNPQIGTNSRVITLGKYRKGFDEFLVPSYKAVSYTGLQGQLTLTPSGGGVYAEVTATDAQGRSVSLFRDMVRSCD
jgi:hypothetical protein